MEPDVEDPEIFLVKNDSENIDMLTDYELALIEIWDVTFLFLDQGEMKIQKF